MTSVAMTMSLNKTPNKRSEKVFGGSFRIICPTKILYKEEDAVIAFKIIGKKLISKVGLEERERSSM